MQGYIIRRLLLIIPTLFLLGTILFLMLQFIPGRRRFDVARE